MGIIIPETELLQALENINYEKKYLTAIHKKNHTIDIPFTQLINQINNPDTQDTIINQPDEFIQTLTEIINQNLSQKYTTTPYTIEINFTDLPNNQEEQIPINQIREQHVGKLHAITGTIKRTTPIFLTTTSITKKCYDCGTNKTYPLKETETPKNTKCPKCKMWTKITEHKEDTQYIDIEEPPQQNQTQRTIKAILRKPLTQHETTNQIQIGKKITLLGKIDSLKKENEKEEHFIIRPYALETQEQENKIETTPEDIKKIQELRHHHPSLTTYWANQLYTSIIGNQNLKEAIITQNIGMPEIKNPNKRIRNQIHIFIIGDKSTAKSQILERTHIYTPRSIFATGAGSTSTGLTASVIRDELTGQWTLEAGALPLAHQSTLIVDEFDKIGEGEQDNLHQALQQGILTINKANIHQTLQCETSFLGAGNPVGKGVLTNDDIIEQTGQKLTFLSRMDIIAILRKNWTPQNQTILRTTITNMNGKTQQQNPEPIEQFLKYRQIAQQIQTTLPDNITEQIVNWIDELMKNNQQNQVGMLLDARSSESIVRLTLAHARTELRQEATQEDYEWAKNQYLESLKQIATDIITGQVTVEKLYDGSGDNEREVMEQIEKYLNQHKGKSHTTEEIQDLFDKKIQDKIPALLQKLYKNKLIYEPRNNAWATY